MNRSQSRVLGATLLVGGLACLSGRAQEPVERTGPPGLSTRSLSVDEALARIWPATERVAFAPTTAEERQAFAKLVPALYTSPATAERWLPLAQSVGFELERWRLPSGEFVALVEQPGRRRGAGAYFFRSAPTGRQPDVLLQAPHAYFDTGTGILAGRVFFGAGPAGPGAFFTNTVHRYQTVDGKREKRSDAPADVCHNPALLFSAATEAVAGVGRGLVVVQLHGFSSADREGAAAVVSAGTRDGSTSRSTAVAVGLRGLLGAGVLRFPEEVDELGATTNAQGRLLRSYPGAAFVHVEMSPGTRKTLQDDVDRLRAVILGAGAQ